MICPPSYRITLERIISPNQLNESMVFGSYVKIAIEIYEKISDCIVIAYSGYNEDVDDDESSQKYTLLADFMRKKIGAVIRVGNNHYQDLNYEKSIQDDIIEVIDYALKNSEKICSAKIPKIYLLGFSAGASAIMAIAHKFSHVQKILLISPSYDAGEDDIFEGLEKFQGEIYILSGENDDCPGPELTKQLSFSAKNASTNELVFIPNCSHYFNGEENRMILFKAPLWAFLGDQNFPSIKGSIEL
jgi:dienelactone hydrolase